MILRFLVRLLLLPLLPFAALMAKGMDGEGVSYWVCLKGAWEQWFED
jgi:hypothetical protein